MSPASDPMAVADQFGRVVEASIMPDCIRANTNVTTMMLGARLADCIRQEMRQALPSVWREPLPTLAQRVGVPQRMAS